MHRLSGITTRAAVVGAVAITTTAFAGGVTHDVTQESDTFVPDEITVAPGDTIVWHWTSGMHTVTSGSSCTPDRKFFNEDLDAAQPTVEFTVPADFSGEIPYFCIPHCFFGMTGVIIVEAPPSCPEDLDQSGDVGFSDLLTILTAWGPCPAGEDCPADLDGSGDVGFSDLLQVLTAWGACP